MTVAENIGFGLKIAGKSRAEIDSAVAEVARTLKLDCLLDRKPRALSGGQRQRVAIGRSLARRPKIFLFDEPLSNLDAALRVEMRVELSKLHQDLGSTMIYVTHDQVEAMTMADRIVVMDHGRIMQIGSPLDLFNRPRNKFVAGFVGQPSINILKITGVVEQGGDTLFEAGGGRFLVAGHAGTAGTPAEIGLRPDWFRITSDPKAAMVRSTVELAEQLGDETLIHTRLASGETLVLKIGGQHLVRKNDQIDLVMQTDHPIIFDAEGNNLFTA